MNKTCFLLLSAELLIGATAFAAAPDIKLSERKDRVLSSKMRMIVLQVAEECLNHRDEGFVTLSQEIQSPYAFKEEVQQTSSAAVAAVAAPVVYDDASILDGVGASLATQVRGSLARGAIYYLQLQGGGMHKSGASFPFKISKVDGGSFTVTVTIAEINSRGYTLTLGDATLTVPFDATTGASSGATKDFGN